MSAYETITRRRSIRRFKQDIIFFDTLKKLVNAGRLAPSASNLQPIEYLIVDQKGLLEKVFTTLKWAGYISPAGNPPGGERPTSYILVLVKKGIEAPEHPRDVGAAIENILLAALEEDIGSCWIRSIDRKRLSKLLNIPEGIEIDSVIALGYKNEDPIEEEMKDSIKYWKDSSGRLHVPKRRLEDILYRNGYPLD